MRSSWLCLRQSRSVADRSGCCASAFDSESAEGCFFSTAENGAIEMIGDWMASIYDVGGRRWDHHLFLDHDGRYERIVRSEQGYERRDTG